MKSSWSGVARAVLAAGTVVGLSLVAGCTSEDPAPRSSATTSEAAHAEPPASRVTVLSSSDAAELALSASQTFFSAAPVVVIADATDPVAQSTAAAAAAAVTAPVLLADGTVSDDAVVTELRRLGASTLVEVSPDPALSSASGNAAPTPSVSGLDGVSVVHLDSDALDAKSGQLDARDLKDLTGALPTTAKPETLHEVLALVEGTPEQTAAVATAQAAGAWPLVVPSGDPRASAETVQAIAQAKPLAVVGIGPSFGSQQDLEWRIKTAESGDELPGGGQLILSDKRVIATPGDAVAGNRQTPLPDADASELIAEAQAAVTAYAESSPDETLVPAIEVPVTMASSSAGSDGDYSLEIPADAVRPVVDAAAAAGVYVVLRFEPGKATFGEQVAEYADLLALPGVGAAFDVTARRGTTAKSYATVTAAELNEAFASLATIVRDHALPQKLVVVQQGKPEAVTDREALNVGAGELAVVLDVKASTAVSTQPAQWTKNLTGAPVGTHGGWTTLSTDPARDIESVAKLNPAPEYVAGAH